MWKIFLQGHILRDARTPHLTLKVKNILLLLVVSFVTYYYDPNTKFPSMFQPQVCQLQTKITFILCTHPAPPLAQFDPKKFQKIRKISQIFSLQKWKFPPKTNPSFWVRKTIKIRTQKKHSLRPLPCIFIHKSRFHMHVMELPTARCAHTSTRACGPKKKAQNHNWFTLISTFWTYQLVLKLGTI